VGAEIIVGLDRIAALAAFVCVMLWIAHTGHASLAQPPNIHYIAKTSPPPEFPSTMYFQFSS
jgi:putative copper export protein